MRLLQHINLQANIEHNFHNKIGSKNKNKRKSDSEDNINFPSKLQITKLNKSGICLAPTCFFLLASPHTQNLSNQTSVFNLHCLGNFSFCQCSQFGLHLSLPHLKPTSTLLFLVASINLIT
jgi:hypothetical protein